MAVKLLQNVVEQEEATQQQIQDDDDVNALPRLQSGPALTPLCGPVPPVPAPCSPACPPALPMPACVLPVPCLPAFACSS